MATIITHPIIPVVAAYLIGHDKVPTKLIIIAGIASIIPDLDVISFRFGIPYGDQLGHRGFTHAIAFAAFLGFLATFCHKYLNTSKVITFTLVFIGACSHGIFDALTDGGQGVAFFWPLTDHRYFFPIRPIEVSPIGIRNFLTPRGLVVLISEFWLIWLPAIAVIYWRKRRN